MFPVSNDYRAMMGTHKIASRIEMTITSDFHVEELTDKHLLDNSVTINWRAANNRDFNLGSCYFAILKFSTVNAGFGHGGLDPATVTLTAFFETEDGEEEIPLGVFRADKVKEHTKTVSWECVDDMVLFDKTVEDETSGTAYWLFNHFCTKCGVTLGSTLNEINNMVNAQETYYIDPRVVLTYRDAMFYVASLIGAFCAIGRDGKLYVKQFHMTSDLTITTNRSKEETVSGLCRFKGVECRFLAEQNFYPYKYVVDNRVGTVLDLGDIPIVMDTEAKKNALLKNLFDNMLVYYEWEMCNIRIVGDPSIEAGDTITYVGTNGSSHIHLLTSVTYELKGDSTLLSEGQDTLANSVSSSRKRSAQYAEASSEEAQVVTVTYTNAMPVSIEGGDNDMLSLLRFVTNKEVTTIFGAELPIYSDGEGLITLTYANSGIEGDVVKARLHEGYNLVTLVNHMHYDANSIVNLTLEAVTSGIGQGDAPDITIDAGAIKTYVFAQGISGEAAWDGIIVLDDDIDISITPITSDEITDAVSVELINVVRATLTDGVHANIERLRTIVDEPGNAVTITLEYVDVCFCGNDLFAGDGGLL